MNLASVRDLIGNRALLWLALVGFGGAVSAADFQLVSSAVVTTAPNSAASASSRFTLEQAKLAPLPPVAPSADARFTLASAAGQIVLLQSAPLPQLFLQSSTNGAVVLVWADSPLFQNLVLETASSVGGAAWQPVANELTPTGRRAVVAAAPPNAPVRFYRLRKL